MCYMCYMLYVRSGDACAIKYTSKKIAVLVFELGSSAPY